MKPWGTLRKRCSNCHVLVLVPAVTPNPESRLMLNGYWVTSMDKDFKNHNRGFLCEPCLDKLMERNKIGFGGFGRFEERFESCEATIDDNEVLGDS